MSPIGTAAMSAAIVSSAITLTDAVYGGITGNAAIWDDTSDTRWAVVCVGVLVLVTYTLFAAVLVENADRIDAGHRWTRWIRRSLVGILATLAGILAWGTILDGYPDILEVTAGVGFLLMFILGSALGIAIVRRPGLRLPGILLTSPIALLPLGILLELVATGWGHPGYAESTFSLGVALLGVDSQRAGAGDEPRGSRVASHS